jgi:hypothetical protein
MVNSKYTTVPCNEEEGTSPTEVHVMAVAVDDESTGGLESGSYVLEVFDYDQQAVQNHYVQVKFVEPVQVLWGFVTMFTMIWGFSRGFGAIAFAGFLCSLAGPWVFHSIIRRCCAKSVPPVPKTTVTSTGILHEQFAFGSQQAIKLHIPFSDITNVNVKTNRVPFGHYTVVQIECKKEGRLDVRESHVISGIPLSLSIPGRTWTLVGLCEPYRFKCLVMEMKEKTEKKDGRSSSDEQNRMEALASRIDALLEKDNTKRDTRNILEEVRDELRLMSSGHNFSMHTRSGLV